MSYTYAPAADAPRSDHEAAGLRDGSSTEGASGALDDQSLETRFDCAFTAALALREKQIQQSYRPIIGIHKWFARRPGSVFRNLLLAEFADEPPATGYWRGHDLRGVIADP